MKLNKNKFGVLPDSCCDVGQTEIEKGAVEVGGIRCRAAGWLESDGRQVRNKETDEATAKGMNKEGNRVVVSGVLGGRWQGSNGRSSQQPVRVTARGGGRAWRRKQSKGLMFCPFI